MSYPHGNRAGESVRITARHSDARPGFEQSMYAGSLIERETGHRLPTAPGSTPKHAASQWFTPGLPEVE